MFSLSIIVNNLFLQVLEEQRLLPKLQQIVNDVQAGLKKNLNFEVKGRILLHKGRYVLFAQSDLINLILKEYHDSPIRGHYGIERTIKRINILFWWKGLTKRVRDYVEKCETF